jgi:hypothetical protein
MGLVVPPVHITDNLQLNAKEYSILLKGVEVARGELIQDHFLAINPGTAREEVAGVTTTEPAFGLPAENYAIKTGIHPSVATQKNIETFKRQIKSIGFSYDWDREVATIRNLFNASLEHLPGVALSRDYKYMCSMPGQAVINKAIKDNKLNFFWLFSVADSLFTIFYPPNL